MSVPSEEAFENNRPDELHDAWMFVPEENTAFKLVNKELGKVVMTMTDAVQKNARLVPVTMGEGPNPDKGADLNLKAGSEEAAAKRLWNFALHWQEDDLPMSQEELYDV